MIFERERLRQRLLHALEALSRQLISMRRWSEAVEVAMAAVNVEPLRESAQRTLAEAHIAEGNLVEAVRCFVAFRALLRVELRAEPSTDFTTLMDHACKAKREWAVLPGERPTLPPWESVGIACRGLSTGIDPS